MFTTDALSAALEGRYTIERLVGEGGMAKVYLARDLRHNRQVALKVLRPDLGAVVGVDRFQSEIQVTANLQHPNLLPLFDSGAAADLLYYVMPFVEGESLRARLDREKQLPVDEAVRLATAIAGALDYAHRKGVVHRDLKPENILIHEGQPLVADFGIALALSNAGGERITQTGLSLGTPQYMSPEQATGDRVIDPRTDVYSLAAVVYEMLTGDPPHTGSSSQAVIARLLTEKPRPMRTTRPSVPAHIEAAVERALEKVPADRFPSAREFGDALADARLVPTSVTASPVPIADSAARRWTARLVPWTVAAVAIVVAVMSRATLVTSPPAALRLQIEIPDSVHTRVGSGSALALSRDGTQLVFVGRARGASATDSTRGANTLYLRRLIDDVSLPIRGTEGAASPEFSPDGQTLLFIAGKLDTDAPVSSLYTISVTGGTPKELARDVDRSAAWTDNGEIIFTSSRGLEVVPATGGDRRLVVPTTSARLILGVETLPGGRDALVTYATSGVIGLQFNRLAAVSLPDGGFRDLGVQGSGARYVAPGYLMFFRGGNRVFAAPFSLRTHAITGPPIPLIQHVQVGAGRGAAPTAVAASTTGLLAFFEISNNEPRNEFIFVDARGGTRPAPIPPNWFQDPRVSPDGHHVAATVGGSAANGVGGAVFVYDVATGREARVSPDSNSARPEWSRDGSRIVYRQTLGDSSIVWSRPWDLSSAPSIVARGSVETFNEIALGPASGLSAIRQGTAGPSATVPTSVVLAPTESLGVQRPLFDRTASFAGISISPNGRLLVYAAREAQRREVYVTPIPGPGPRVQVSSGGGSEPMWSRDGRVVFYRSGTATRRDALIAATIVEQPALAVSRRDSLFPDVFQRSGSHTNYDVLPDGRFVMVRPVAATPQRDRLVIVVNWQQLIESSKTNR